MFIGIPKEIKEMEFRVSSTPNNVKELVANSHKVFVQKTAGLGAGFSDEEYKAAGAEMLDTIEDVYEKAEMIIKVKEPLPPEFSLMKEGLILFTYLHLAPVPDLTDELLKDKITGIAYETIEKNGTLPLLIPMSEVAGRMAVQVGAFYLQKHNGGRGVLLGGVPGVPPGKVVIVGGGLVGTNAAKMAIGLGARVYILDVDTDRLRYLDDVFGGRLHTVMSSPGNIADQVKDADLLVGAVLIPGAKAPKLVTDEMVATMPEGSVIVDVAIDQGGCVETIKTTTHADPIYTVHGVVHYGVANMPGAFARSSTLALTNATSLYAIKIANMGWKDALRSDEGFLKGLNVYDGQLTCAPVAEAQGRECVDPKEMIIS
ncbi:MAG: alanine dehydrogenase [Thermodesulfobacteriota bacterium]|nr:alanine dehydrogenase [Thermodesulfobacteriota bacterium]